MKGSVSSLQKKNLKGGSKMFVELDKKKQKLVNVNHIVDLELIEVPGEGFKWILTLSTGSKKETPIFSTYEQAMKWKHILIAISLKA
jgi:hypothetical protein